LAFRVADNPVSKTYRAAGGVTNRPLAPTPAP